MIIKDTNHKTQYKSYEVTHGRHFGTFSAAK